jgi:transcriptional regulator with XRE-family HTH domain
MPDLSPAQCRAARGLIEWSQRDLAEAAQVGLSTVRNFESGRSVPVTNNLFAIRRALESAGVEFIAENGGGAGVRLRKSGASHETAPSARRSIGPEDEDRTGPEAPED